MDSLQCVNGVQRCKSTSWVLLAITFQIAIEDPFLSKTFKHNIGRIV